MDLRRVIVDPETSIEVEVPDFATDESALAKAKRRAAGNLPTFSLAPDYGCVVPLWGSDGDGPIVDLDAIGVSTELADELRRWQAEWESHFHYEHGWPSEHARETWHREGERIYAALFEQLWDIADISPQFRDVI